MKYLSNLNSLILAAVLLALVFPATLLARQQPTPKLKVGDKAPQLHSLKWLNGAPVVQFQKGMVYIVEFGFVGCAPCRLSIPELTRLQARFPKKLHVVSMHIWENSRAQPENLTYVSRVEKFVAKMGDKIGYTVGVDVPSQATADNWMKAAGLEAVPKSFVVDGDGRIAWIGQPDQLAPLIEKMMAGRFDADLTAQKQNEHKANLEKRRTAMLLAKDRRDFGLALTIADSLISEHPTELALFFDKFRILNEKDDAAAASYVQWMLDEGRKDFDGMMYYICKAMLSRPGANLDLAIAAADRGLTVTEYIPSQAGLLDATAEVYYKKGMLDKAIALQKQAADIHRPYGAELLEGQQNLDQRLERYIKLSDQ